jgi:hypothetical protein
MSGRVPTPATGWRPTAMQALVEAQLTPAKEGPLPGLGGYSMVQPLPLQPSAKVD